MPRKIALFFSFLLHPLFIPTAGILIILNSDTYLASIPETARRTLIGVIGSGTLILPAIMIPLMSYRGMISGIQIINHRERTTPLALTLIFYILTFYLFLQIPVYRIIHGFMVGCISGLFVTLLISFRWKISIHMVGLGGFTAFLLMMSVLHDVNLFIFLVITIFASGLAGSSRLFLNAHSPEQVYAGYFMGFLLMTLSLVIL